MNLRLGCLFLNNRYHDPTLGTFISVDPLVQMTGEPYIYGSGNPTTLSDPTGLCSTSMVLNGCKPSQGLKFGNVPCGKSGAVCGDSGVYYGNVSKPASGTGSRNGGSLPATYYPATTSPACASLGPDGDSCSVPVPEQWVPHTTGSGGANEDLAALFVKAGFGALLSEVGESAAWEACGRSMGVGPACDAAEALSNGIGPDQINAFAAGDLVDFVHATAVYGCGTSAGGTTVTCVDSQRLPVFSSGMNRVAYGHYVFCEPSCLAEGLPHEFVHVRQFEVNGDAMALSYLWQSMLHGYRDNPYEVEAYNVGR